MRALASVLLVAALLGAAAGAHVHEASASDECAVCVLRHADAPRAEAPDVAPRAHVAAALAVAPGLSPVTGAPLGAVPGQSPPA